MTFTIGMAYGGGKVAYIDGTGQHGLIAAVNNQSTSKYWHATATGTAGASGIAIGTGSANTDKIIALYGAESNAARICYDLVEGGYSDWYLPSRDELNQLYINRTAIGNFALSYYWSSSEFSSATYAWFQNFGDGFQGYTWKYSTYYVRAVRAF
jgi:hypothetical protein